MAHPPPSRGFSTDKHRSGDWDTRVFIARNPLLRLAASYCSFKRAGVDNLAKTSGRGRFVLDAGAGKGAYSHWYLGRRPGACCVAVDWSEHALRGLRPSAHGRILPVCADLRFLPFKSASMDALFSVDALGHIDHCESALDEFLRVCKSASLLFLHSECGDYRNRWPESELLRQSGRDLLARLDGHDFLKSAGELHELYSRRFRILLFLNPAGYLGFLIGYPEKYRPAFTDAHWRTLAVIASVFALLKKAPIVGISIRLVNAFTNRCEAFFRLTGGGSCLAMLKKP